MSNISKAFKKGKALITFIMAGDPSLSKTETLVPELEKSGADIIEIGIPFSDSIADGPTITEAAERAIRKGTNAAKVIRAVKKIRKKTQIPIVLMTSYNIVFSYGIEKFINDSSKAGVDGLILPDLPIEGAKDISKKAQQKGVDLIFLVAPNSAPERIRMAARHSRGFIYMMSLTGTTGERKQLSGEIGAVIKKIRKYTNKPIAVGFGISTPQQAGLVSKHADGVIVGSAIVKLIHENIKKVPKFIAELKKAICTC
ncbi:MAG: tryptophan synthase subunit alpha [Candidatus Saganbacteria bacterium]|nr:tryptophan synthase subunit alpha [Candidatus Saganbacteria bacterium]